MIINIKVFVAADKYLVPALRDRAKDKFLLRVRTGWFTVAFPKAVKLAYDYIDENTQVLRDIIGETVYDKAEHLFNGPGEDGFEDFIAVAMEAPQLLVDHAKRLAGKAPPSGTSPAGVDWYQCPGTYCKKYSTVFSVSKDAPGKSSVQCPLKCSVPQKKDYWIRHRIKEKVIASENTAVAGKKA